MTRAIFVFVALLAGACAIQPTIRRVGIGRTITTSRQTGDGYGYLLTAIDRVSRTSGSEILFYTTTADFQGTNRGFPRFRTWFYTHSTDAVELLTFRVGLFGLCEFNDTDPTGVFNKNLIIPGKTIKLAGTGAAAHGAWSTMTAVTVADPATGVMVTTLSTSLDYSWGAGLPTTTLTITARISEDSIVSQVANGSVLAPYAIKFDLEIDNWYWSAIPNTKLALITGILSREVLTEFGTNPNPTSSMTESSVQVGSDSEAQFSWVQQVQANYPSLPTSNVPLKYTTLWAESTLSDWTPPPATDTDRQAGEAMSHVVFTFDTPNHPSRLLWDPSVAMPNSGAARGVSVLVLLVSMLAVWLVRQ